jgi:hypothetical protein
MLDIDRIDRDFNARTATARSILTEMAGYLFQFLETVWAGFLTSHSAGLEDEVGRAETVRRYMVSLRDNFFLPLCECFAPPALSEIGWKMNISFAGHSPGKILRINAGLQALGLDAILSNQYFWILRIL